jgi:hypothetical protein
MSLNRGLRAEHLHPAGKQTIAAMLAKGWMELQPDGRTYRKTLAGDEALKANIPVR